MSLEGGIMDAEQEQIGEGGEGSLGQSSKQDLQQTIWMNFNH